MRCLAGGGIAWSSPGRMVPPMLQWWVGSGYFGHGVTQIKRLLPTRSTLVTFFGEGGHSLRSPAGNPGFLRLPVLQLSIWA